MPHKAFDVFVTIENDARTCVSFGSRFKLGPPTGTRHTFPAVVGQATWRLGAPAIEAAEQEKDA